ncbi:MAG TPA: PCRF domain-containing protein, partial [Agitococcus sp.]|nr:PCRF domain-containing protein [Agitococcus sp.]
MKASIRSRLEQLSERYEEVTALLSDSSTISDNEKFRKLSREHSELGEITQVWQAFCQAEQDLATAQEMKADPEFKEIAEEEIDAALKRIDQLTEQLNVLMIP